MHVHEMHHGANEAIGADNGALAERCEQRDRDAVYVGRCLDQGGFRTLVIAYAPHRPNRQLKPAYV